MTNEVGIQTPLVNLFFYFIHVIATPLVMATHYGKTNYFKKSSGILNALLMTIHALYLSAPQLGHFCLLENMYLF